MINWIWFLLLPAEYCSRPTAACSLGDQLS